MRYHLFDHRQISFMLLLFYIDRCQWELTQWIRDESEGVRTPMLRQFYDYMISLSENLDAIFLTTSKKYYILGSDNNEFNDISDDSSSESEENQYDDDEEDELKEYREIQRKKKLEKQKKREAKNKEKELWQLDELNFQFEMMTRIKELTECVEDALEAKFVLDVIEALDNDVFCASPILQSVLKYIGNDIKFMCVLRESSDDIDKCTQILESMERYNAEQSPLPVVWQLVQATQGNEILVETILVETNNIQEYDPEIMTNGLLKAYDDDIDAVIPIYDIVVRWFNNMNKYEQGYLYNHIREIMMMVNDERKRGDNDIRTDILIQYCIMAPLVSPYEMKIFWREHKDKTDVDQLNHLSTLQIKYEQYQLFLGRYLLYCPFKTKAVETGKYDDYKDDQDEIEFYGEEDDSDDDDSTAMLIELTIDIDNVTRSGIHNDNKQQFTKRLTIKKSLCVKNYDTLEYEPDHYYEDELLFSWDVLKYEPNNKILRLNNTRCKWIANLDGIEKINPSYANIEFNPEDLNNELRGYLVLLPDEDGKLSFVNDLFKKWNKTRKSSNKWQEVVHKMEERPIFVSMEKWKLTDNY